MTQTPTATSNDDILLNKTVDFLKVNEGFEPVARPRLRSKSARDPARAGAAKAPVSGSAVSPEANQLASAIKDKAKETAHKPRNHLVTIVTGTTTTTLDGGSSSSQPAAASMQPATSGLAAGSPNDPGPPGGDDPGEDDDDDDWTSEQWEQWYMEEGIYEEGDEEESRGDISETDLRDDNDRDQPVDGAAGAAPGLPGATAPTHHSHPACGPARGFARCQWRRQNHVAEALQRGPKS